MCVNDLRFPLPLPLTSTPHLAVVIIYQMKGRRNGSSSSTVVHAQVSELVDCVRRRVGEVGRGRGSFVLPVLQHLVGHVLGAFLDVSRTAVVAGREQILQTLPVLVQVHPG